MKRCGAGGDSRCRDRREAHLDKRPRSHEVRLGDVDEKTGNRRAVLLRNAGGKPVARGDLLGVAAAILRLMVELAEQARWSTGQAVAELCRQCILGRRLRRYRKVHVICDDAKFHTTRSVIEYPRKHAGRIEVDLLLDDSPDLNSIERVWRVLHEHVTRDHRCKSLEELLGMVFARPDERDPFHRRGF